MQNKAISSFQCVYQQTALFAGTEAQLLGNLPAGEDPTSADTAVRIFAYTGLLLNLGATLSAILLLIAVSSLPATARQVYISCSHGYPRQVFHNHTAHIAELNDRLLKGHGETYILRSFGIARGWGLLLRHCILCFISGCVCAFVHLGINLWLSETTLVAAIVMPALLFGVVPPLVIFCFYMDSPSCHECLEERYSIVVFLLILR